MPRSTGNTALKVAVQAVGISSQSGFIKALSRAARQLNLGQVTISPRQVSRWYSDEPGWPRDEHQRLITYVTHLPIESLGFRAPWQTTHTAEPATTNQRAVPARAIRPVLPRPTSTAACQPDTIGADYAIVTTAHRRLYWTVAPAALHQSVQEHANLGAALLGETAGVPRQVLASALAESLLLAGRIQFFDLRQPDQADATLLRALQAAGEADDALLGAAILAHTAFIPGWDGRREEAVERMQAARTYARRGPASAELLAWLDAVEAECLTRCGDHREALALLRHGEDVLAAGSEYLSPDWLDWFNPVRLAAFKGNTELKAGLLPQARSTLQQVLDDLGDTDGKQRVVVLGDLAAVEAAASRPAESCAYLQQALDQLDITWYAMGMDRVRDAHRALAPWRDSPEVQMVADRLYSWTTTLSALQR